MTIRRDSSVNSIIFSRRKTKKINQGEMAKKLGLSLRQYQYYESGTGKMSMDKLLDICQILDLQLILIPKELIL